MNSIRGFRAACRLMFVLTLPVLLAAGCSGDVFLSQTASVGGETAGTAGEIEVIFINNTPHRAIFTYGTYNNANPNAAPDVGQFVGELGQATLEGDAFAPALSLTCDRAFAIGDPELLRAVTTNLDDGALAALDEGALIEGIAFSGAALGDDNAAVATEGFSEYVRALLGVDFPCGAVLIIRFEVNDLGAAPFRADFEVIPPRDDDRGV